MIPEKVKRVFTGYVPGKAQHKAIQCKTILLIAYIAIPTAVIFSIINYLSGHHWLALVEVVTVLLLLPCFKLKHHPDSLLWIRNLLMLNAFLTFTSLFIDGGIANSGVIWSLVVPFFAFLLMGLPVAWYWVGAYSLINLLLISLHFSGIITLPYDDDALLYFPAVFLFFSLIAAVFEVQLERLHHSHEETIDELEILRNSLESHVEVKTRELTSTNEKLRLEIKGHKNTAKALKISEESFIQAQKMEALGTLVGGIAHDFNNMLSGITANIFLAKRKIQDPYINEKLTTVEKLNDRASKMIQQLLTFARKDMITMKVFNLTTFINEVVGICDTIIPKNINIKRNFCQENLFIKGDRTQIHQVIMNLINNAQDAMIDSAEPSIVLHLKKVHADKALLSKHPDITGTAFAKFSIRDNGYGINDQDLKHIFDPFFTTKEADKGTGLGLSMSYGAIHSHKGVIDAESKPGQGTTFNIYLPLTTGLNLNKNDEQAAEFAMGNGEFILLTDDNNAMRKATREVLEHLNYKVIEASNGLQAIEIFKSHQHDIDLVIMDLVMPQLGGIDAIRAIKKLSPQIKVVFCSAYDKDQSLQPNSQETVVGKPYDVANLSNIIRDKLTEE